MSNAGEELPFISEVEEEKEWEEFYKRVLFHPVPKTQDLSEPHGTQEEWVWTDTSEEQ